ncbi:MAG TPA: O-antigen ligase family protein [Gemmatimonadales bacterium]|nr:O-antigen ligase family protein [Gemmatimonadales bacterium]
MADAPPTYPPHIDGWPRSSAAPQVSAPTRSARTAGWDLLLVCVAVHIANYVGRVPQLFPVLLPLRVALVAKLLAIGLYVLHQPGPRRVALLRSPTTTCVLGLLLWGGMSVPGALYQGLAFRAWTDFASPVVMFLVIAGSIRSARDVERFGLVYFGVTVLYTTVVLSRFQLDAADWRLGDLYYYDANDFATLIVTAMPFGLYVVLAQRRPLLRLLAVLGLAVLAVGLTRSGSRGGFLALLAVVAFFLLGFTTIRARSRLVGLVVVLAVVFTTASDRYWTQMQTILNPDQDYNVASDEGRLKVWERGLGYLAGRPVLGVGISNFQVAEGTIAPKAKLRERGLGVRWQAAHNSFIQVGAELGTPGLLLFIALFATAFASLRRVARHARGADPPAADVSRLAQTLMAALVGFVVGAFFLSLAYTDMLYTLAALAVGLRKVASTDDLRIRRLAYRAPGWRVRS